MAYDPTQLNNFIPNPPAPERAFPERTGAGPDWTNDGPNPTQGITPLGPNNPSGQVPGIPVMAIIDTSMFGPQTGAPEELPGQ